MKIFIFVFLFSLSLFADCYQSLSNNYQDASYLYAHESQVGANAAMSSHKQADLAARFMMENKGCSQDEIQAKFRNITCSSALRGPVICHVDSKFGYFVIFRDYVESFHITFNRWD